MWKNDVKAIESLPFHTVNQDKLSQVADVGGEIESGLIWAVCKLNWLRLRKGHRAGQAPISAPGLLVRQPQLVLAMGHSILRRSLVITTITTLLLINRVLYFTS